MLSSVSVSRRLTWKCWVTLSLIAPLINNPALRDHCNTLGTFEDTENMVYIVSPRFAPTTLQVSHCSATEGARGLSGSQNPLNTSVSFNSLSCAASLLLLCICLHTRSTYYTRSQSVCVLTQNLITLFHDQGCHDCLFSQSIAILNAKMN